MDVSILSDPRCREHLEGGHPERPERVDAILEALTAANFDHLTFKSPHCADPADLARAHSMAQIQAVRTLCESGGGWFDADTYCTPGSWEAALLAVGAAMDAVDIALMGQHAFAVVRPPGHHASTTKSMGFCLFNNIACAVRHVQNLNPHIRIAIIDIDVHHGNGTEEIFAHDAQVFYASQHEWPLFPGTGLTSPKDLESGTKHILNIPISAGVGETEWLYSFDKLLLPAVRSFDPQCILVSAGFDAHRSDPLADLKLESTTFGAIADRVAGLAKELYGGGTAWVLEGGYDLAALGASAVELVRQLLAS